MDADRIHNGVSKKKADRCFRGDSWVTHDRMVVDIYQIEKDHTIGEKEQEKGAKYARCLEKEMRPTRITQGNKK